MIVGFAGTGNMGSALVGIVRARGFDVVAHDAAGVERVPEGATAVESIAELAARAETIVCSLPDGAASATVAEAVASAAGRRTQQVIDTSTIGFETAVANAERLGAAGVGYVDAPVSGGVSGARARTLTVLVAGAPDDRAAVEEVLAALSDRRVVVGDRPGMAQALKLLNNFLSATALAATSEAVAYGRAAGLDPATMMEALNASSGRNTATLDKFPNHVLPGTYDSGFANTLMAKDVGLYLDGVAAQGTPAEVGRLVADIWERFADAEPGVDFTRIHPFVSGAD